MKTPTIVQRARAAPAERRRAPRRGQPHQRPRPADRKVEGHQLRERATPGPEDRALYSCRCGSTFQAPVTASVGCPHCGEPQAW
jgi:hypothetical protein